MHTSTTYKITGDSQRRQLLSDAFHEVLLTLECDRAPSTIRSYRQAAENFVRLMHDIRLSEVTTRHADGFKALRVKEVRPVSVNVDLRSLKAMFSMLRRWEYIPTNPFQAIKLVRVPEEAPWALSKEEVARLVSSIQRRDLRAVVIFAYYTGARLHEILSLRWDAVDMAHRRITIRNTAEFTTKSKKIRVLPMNARLADELIGLQKVSAASDFVFVNNDGRALQPSHVSHQFKRQCRSLGFSEKIHFHSLRHTFATHLIEAGTPLYDVSKLLGHAHITTTERYAHLYPEDRSAIVNILSI